MSTAWAHLHLPRHLSGDPNPISVKVPGQRIDYVSWLSMTDVEFKVSQPGRRRCIREGVRNVHAWVVGTEVLRVQHGDWVGEFGLPVRADRFRPPAGYGRVVYDPWKGHTFVDAETLAPVLTARYAILSGKNVYFCP